MNSALQLGSADWPYPTSGIPVTGGATRGSNVVTVARGATFAVGSLCHIAQEELSYVRGTVSMPQIITFRIVAKNQNTITLNHALPCDFTNSPILVSYPSSPIEGVGVEDLTIDCNNLTPTGIQAEQAWGCWIENVEIKRSTNRQMLLIVFNQSEIRHCYTHETLTTSGPNHEGIDLFNRSCWNLVEDNLCDNGGFPQITLGDEVGGNACNVIAYNFCVNTVTGTSVAGADISFNHGAHNSFNLAEGNIVGNGISSDGYYGSSSHNTILRNWALAKPYTAGVPNPIAITSGLRAIQLNRMSNYYNVVGNVLGDLSFSTVPGIGNYTSEAIDYPETQLIYQLGYPNLGNTRYTETVGPQFPPDYTPFESLPSGYQALDLNVKTTLIRHGNYDYFTRSQLWDPNISDHTIPDSYYLERKAELVWTSPVAANRSCQPSRRF